MIIDKICDILDAGEFTEQDAREIYQYGHDDINRALDGGTESDIKQSLSDYIGKNGYNPELSKQLQAVPMVGAGYKFTYPGMVLTRVGFPRREQRTN